MASTTKLCATILAVLLTAAVIAGVGAAQEPTVGEPQKPAYIGSAKCKMCHISQHKVWAVSEHAKAFALLEPEDVKKKECVICHVTGLLEEGDAFTFSEEGIGCESCHGPGSLYAVKTVKDKKKFAADPEATRALWRSLGLQIASEATCTGCHSERSPTFKGFDSAKAMAAIKHWSDEPAAGTTSATK